ncbi:MAG: ABC transporter substrate-binding protein [Dorea sp.]|uniref:ABC transporter substrate-binding protein n=1 Tax=Sporofaciens sp. JLR.KK001 TaxID=3112621 RepID=UPI00216E2AA7|nr:ABC transporter substrate-binding protein [Dorea sp.]
MKKRIQKLTALLLFGSLTVSLLTGCGGGNSGSSGGDGSSSSEESSESSGGAGEVTLWHYFEHEAPDLEAIVEKYNEEQDKIHITATYVSREELMNQYTIGAVSGELPDIGMVDSPDMASYVSLGVFEDITDDVGSWEDLDQFYPGPLLSCQDADGKYYGLPNNSNCLTLACNMDILKKAGFNEPPTTWDEFRKVCEKTTNASDGVYGFAMCAIGTEEGTFQLLPWICSAGGNIDTLDSPESIKGIQFLTDLVQDGLMSKEVINWQQSEAYNSFCAGKAAMLESGTWQLADIDEKINGTFEYQYALLPKDEEYSSTIGGENFGVCTGTEYRDECVDFLKYLMNAQNNADFTAAAAKLPVRKDAVSLNELFTTDERYAVFNEGMNYARARGPHAQWPTLSEAFYTAVQQSLLGEKSAEDAMKDAAATIDPIVAEDPLPEASIGGGVADDVN